MYGAIMVFIIIGIIVVVLITVVIRVFNLLTREQILTQEGFSGIGAGLQQRNDLIPNLVETVKGYAGHENKTLTEVIKWRNQSAAATTVTEQSEASKGLNQSLLNLMAITENYPDLKADGQFRELMSQLAAIEEKLNDARRYYNGTVRKYNQRLGVFPNNLVGKGFGFKPAVFFAEDVEARVAPKVKFG